VSCKQSVRGHARALLVPAVLLSMLACHEADPSPSSRESTAAALPTERTGELGGGTSREVTAAGSIEAVAIDPGSGLVLDERTPLVIANCTVCHSAKLVIQNRGTRSDWEQRVRSMQKDHSLWALEASVQDAILDYLSEHYAPDPLTRSVRRLPLRAHLLPPSRSDLERPRAMGHEREDGAGESEP